jgi:adenylate cyclase class 2
MAQEIEVKYRLDDPASILARLGACGARRITHLLQTNRIFDTADRKLLAADCGLRLRTSRALEDEVPVAATLTYKGPRARGAAKLREEIETAVADPSAVATILSRLGFVEVIIYEKRRETWRLDECEICLDELPRLGWFIEIEGPSPTAVEAVGKRLELADRAPLRETYVELAARHGSSEEGHCPRLEFEA